MVKTIGEALPSLVATGDRKQTVENVWKRVADACYGIDKDAFTELINGLWEGCGRTVKPNETTLRVWYFCLHDLTEEQLARGIMRYLTERSSEFLSVQIIRELSGVLETRGAAALEAWQEAIDAVRVVGSYRSPVFTNTATSHVIESLGGWDWFCDQSPEQLREWVRGRFLKTFEVFALSAKTLKPTRLPNLLTKTGGKMVEMPARIGVSAHRVLERLEVTQ